MCAVIGLIGLLAYDGAAEWLVMLPVCAAVIRAVATWRSLLDAICRPIAAAVVLAGLWGLLTLAWSSDRANGLDELSAFRHALLIPALWPLREHRTMLIGALAVGFALGHLTQVGHAIGVWFGAEWLKWPRLPDRNSGWWDPVVGGSLLTAAVGLHVPAAVWGRGRARWVGVAGACAALGGVAATGTRGAWIATAMLLAGAAVLVVWRWLASPHRTLLRNRERRTLGIALGAALLTVMLAGVAAGPEVVGRAGRGVAELRRVIEVGDFTSDTGRRLFMWIESWRAFRSSPVGGIGAGDLNAWAKEGALSRGLDPGFVLPHAHGMWVHLAATQGAVGVALWLGVLGVAIACGLAAAPRSAAPMPRGAPGLAVDLDDGYCLAPVVALVGLSLAGLFDTIHVNSQTAMLLFALVGLCAMGRRAPAVGLAPS